MLHLMVVEEGMEEVELLVPAEAEAEALLLLE